MSKIKIACAADVKEGATLKFEFARGGKRLGGFLARFNGELVAYENRCRHLPVQLDYGDGHFFTSDGKHFACQAHHALYDPLTGLCLQGPCESMSLKRLPIKLVDGEIWL